MKGDVSRLRRAAKKFVALAHLVARGAKVAAPKVSEAVQKQYVTGTDAAGKPWKKLKKATLRHGRHPPPNVDTGTMKAASSARALPNGIAVRVSVPYASYALRKRPLARRGKGRKVWVDELKKAYSAEAKGLMRGG